MNNIDEAYEAGYKKGLEDAGVHFVAGCNCVDRAKVFGLEDSIRGAKFPMSVNIDALKTNLTDGIKSLAQSKKGEGHDQWLTGVIVQFDLTFSNKAFVEAERYHFLDFVSSQSTMHRITKFELDNVFMEYTDERIIAILKEKVDAYNEFVNSHPSDPSLYVNDEWEKIQEETARRYLEILYSNPAGFRLTARMTTNYRQLKTIYSQRKAHRLPEWREFCKWIETLPRSELITGNKENTYE